MKEEVRKEDNFEEEVMAEEEATKEGKDLQLPKGDDLTEAKILKLIKDGWQLRYYTSPRPHFRLQKYVPELKGNKMIYIPVKFKDFCKKVMKELYDYEVKDEDTKLEKLIEETTKENTEKEESLLPFPPQIEPPEKFFEDFMSQYPVKKEFIKLLKSRIKRINRLPSPQELAADMLQMGSGINNVRVVNYIAEEYAYALQDYLSKYQQNQADMIGLIGITPPQVGLTTNPHSHTWSIQVPQLQQYYNPISPPSYQPHTYIYNPPTFSNNPGIYTIPQQTGYGPTPARHDSDRTITMKDFLLWQKEQELRQLKEKLEDLKETVSKLKEKKEEPSLHSIYREKIEKLEAELRKRDEARIRELENELRAFREKTLDERIMSAVQAVMKEKEEKLTKDDIAKIVKNVLSDIEPKTKADYDFLIEKKKLELEEKKLDEKGKTREAIAGAIQRGFQEIGRAIYRTLTEEGAITTPIRQTVQGYTDVTQTLMQLPCPYCNALITAPIGQSVITCPSCGKKWEVAQPSPTTQPVGIEIGRQEKEVVEEKKKEIETKEKKEEKPKRMTRKRKAKKGGEENKSKS